MTSVQAPDLPDGADGATLDPHAQPSEALLRSSFEHIYTQAQMGPSDELTSKRWLYRFPVSLELLLRPFDDPVLRLAQRLDGRWLYWLCLGITALFAIEVIIVAPFVLHILGYDRMATELTYLALMTTMISQIPKRFVWRYRPWMVGRAQKRRKDRTSSFPSRAVTCAVVYLFALCWLLRPAGAGPGAAWFAWWMPLACAGAVLLASLARLSLGVHYPSDCAAAVLQGALICLLAMLLWRADLMGCQSCDANLCYAQTVAGTLTWHSLGALNWFLFAFIALVSVLVAVLSIVPPLSFWVKCDRVYGLLLPCLLFQLAFLCPNATSDGAALPPPPSPSWYSVLCALGFAGVALLAGAKGSSRFALLGFVIMYSSVLAALVAWRLWAL